jgi:hypothetical protein
MTDIHFGKQLFYQKTWKFFWRQRNNHSLLKNSSRWNSINHQTEKEHAKLSRGFPYQRVWVHIDF